MMMMMMMMMMLLLLLLIMLLLMMMLLLMTITQTMLQGLRVILLLKRALCAAATRYRCETELFAAPHPSPPPCDGARGGRGERGGRGAMQRCV